MFESIYGFSCVENQVLAQLRQSDEDISRLYGKSFISLAELYEAFFVHNETPEYFSDVPRIQDQLKKINAISLELKMGEVPQGNEVIFVRIKPDFVTQKLMARGFRDDHFALLQDGHIFNDLPEHVVKAEDREEFYAGSYFIFKKLRRLSEEDYHCFEYNKSPESFVVPEDILSEHVYMKTRNFLQILKIIMYRYKSYSRKECRIEVIDSLFALCEYYGLRKTAKPEPYRELLIRANELYNATLGIEK